MIKKIVTTLLLVSFLTGLPVLATAVSPKETVKTTVDSVLGLLRDKRLSKEARRQKMGALIEANFDFRAMSQRTLATNWKKASNAEKDRFVELFSKLIQNTYVTRVEAYTDEKIEYPEEKIKGKKAVVDTVIISGNTNIPVNYKMRLKKGKWLVYDVIIEEVSLISSYRSTYQEMVKKEGFPGLFAQMEKKIKTLETQPAAG